MPETESADNAVNQALFEVRNSAVRLLARREHSRTELRNKLLLRKYQLSNIEEVLDQLAARGLQCDERFAESYTRMRVNRGYGARKIRAELLSRDVAGDVIDRALANTDECWVENATAVLSKKHANITSWDSNSRERAKIQRFLWSRGYNSEQIKQAIKSLQGK